MHIADIAKPATDRISEPVSSIERLTGQLENADTSALPALQLRCELIGNDVAIRGDIKARGALDMCRQLLFAGADPSAELLCYCGGQLALRVRTIGAGAKLVVRETVTGGPR